MVSKIQQCPFEYNFLILDFGAYFGFASFRDVDVRVVHDTKQVHDPVVLIDQVISVKFDCIRA